MTRSRKIGAVVYFVLLGTAAIALGLWLNAEARRRNPEPTPPGPLMARPATWGWPVHLIPISLDADAQRQDPEKVWNDLFAGVAADPVSAKLFRELMGGARVQLETTTATTYDDPTMREPAGAGFDVVFRFRSTYSGKKAIHPTADGPVPYLFGRVGHAAFGPQEFFAGDAASEFDALNLVIEDHVLRQASGWRFVHSTSPQDDILAQRKQPKTLEELRADLNRRIREYTQRYRSFRSSQAKP